jgi:TetR/AcrR family transcriptional repressor of nem operon
MMRAAATAGFLKLVDALAGEFAKGTPDQARRRATVAALTLIGALTVSRVVTDQALSDAVLRSAQDSITGSQTTGGKKAKRGG